METYERIIAAEKSGIYESNYLKANAPDGSGAFWLKHNVLAPPEEADLPPAAEFWCVVWRDVWGWRPRVWKRVMPLDQVGLAPDRIAIDAGEIMLTHEHASGRHEAGASDSPSVSWDLAIRDELPPLLHLGSAWMYEKSFPRKKVVTGSPRAVFDGTFTVGDETIAVDGWIGHRNHNWGTEHAHRYVYGGCNIWDQDVDLTIEGFTVQVRLAGPVKSPWLTLLRGMRDGTPYGAGTVGAMVRQSGRVEWPEWTAYGGRRGASRMRLGMRLDPDHVAGLRYLHPDGDVSYCYNAKDAEVVLLYGGDRFTSSAGELEFLFPEPIDGIALHGHETIEELRAEL